MTEPEGAKIKCQKYDTCKDEFRSIGSCFMQDCFEGAVRVPQATRERYKEHGQQREATCFRDEQRKLNMLIKETERTLADFGLRIGE